MYGRTSSPIEEIEHINASHVFSDILSMAHESHKPQALSKQKKRPSKLTNSTSPCQSQVPFPPFSLISHLMAVFCDQRPPWRDLFVLGKSPRRLRRIDARLGSSAKGDESDVLPREQIPAFYA
jgi:hypothetical protein